MNFENIMDEITSQNFRIEYLYGVWAKMHGMSYHTLMVLYVLQEHQPCTQKEITQHWLLTKQTVNTVIKDLETKGYVQLVAGRNQKEKLVTVTDTGMVYMKQVLDATEAMEKRVLLRLGEEKTRQIAQELKHIADIFQEEVEQYAK